MNAFNILMNEFNVADLLPEIPEYAQRENSFVFLYTEDLPIRVTCIEEDTLILDVTLGDTSSLDDSAEMMLINAMLEVNTLGIYGMDFSLSRGSDNMLVLSRRLMLSSYNFDNLLDEIDRLGKKAKPLRQYVHLYTQALSLEDFALFGAVLQ